MTTVLCSLVIFLFCVNNIQNGNALRAHRAFVPHFNPDGRIIGGNESVPHSLPYSVGLIINGDAFCGGSLISPNYVLTAAHCGTVIKEVEIILGAHNHTEREPTQVRLRTEAKNVIIHKDYNKRNYHNDIALIKLPRPVTMNEYIQKVHLPTRKDVENKYEGLTVKISGWGLTHDKKTPGMKDISDVLRFVETKVMDHERCKEYYNEPDIEFVYDGNFCTRGNGNKGTCNSDGGSPVVYNGVQIGLTTFRIDLCESCMPSVFTNIAKHLDWIEDNSDVVIC